MHDPRDPSSILGVPVIQWSRIDHRHRVTGACIHFDVLTGIEDPTPTFIAIAAGEGSGFFLGRFSETWEFITDTWHESLDEALHQAEVEYEGVSRTWEHADS